MEHNSSYNKQLKNKITARAVGNKEIQMLEIDKDEKKMKK